MDMGLEKVRIISKAVDECSFKVTKRDGEMLDQIKLLDECQIQQLKQICFV